MQMTIQRRFCRRPGLVKRPYCTLRLPPSQGGGRHHRKGGRHESETPAAMVRKTHSHSAVATQRFLWWLFFQ